MNERILVLFEETQKYKKEDLTQFISLNRKETTVSTLEEVLKNKIIKDFYYILDCTFEHKAFNANVNSLNCFAGVFTPISLKKKTGVLVVAFNLCIM